MYCDTWVIWRLTNIVDYNENWNNIDDVLNFPWSQCLLLAIVLSSCDVCIVPLTVFQQVVDRTTSDLCLHKRLFWLVFSKVKWFKRLHLAYVCTQEFFVSQQVLLCHNSPPFNQSNFNEDLQLPNEERLVYQIPKQREYTHRVHLWR